MKKILIALIIILIIILFVNKNNYPYKKELKDIGYTNKIIKKINNTFTKDEINNHLLDIKYDKLFKYNKSPLFKIENINRYYNYDKYNDYNYLDIVKYVEIGLDKDFYTNIKEISDYDSDLVLVNKYNKLPNNYQENNLITLKEPYSYNNQKVKKTIYDNLIKMINDASKSNIKLFVISGYRTEDYQDKLFTNSLKRNGIEHALKYSAKKGHSEHQTGLAIDINSTESEFKNTKEYLWLKNNSYKYGFIERYKENKEFITGYAYEPWHYRYVGIEVSSYINKKNITFEEYYVLKDFLNKQ